MYRYVDSQTMSIMADSGLEVGTIIECKTQHGQELKGEVAAWDLNRKALVIVSQPSTPNGRNDIHVLNVTSLAELTVVKDPTKESEAPLPSLDTSKLSRRVKDNVGEKLTKVNSIGVGVTREAQDIFNSIRKTIDHVKWEGKTISILKDVTITEPYTENDIQLRQGGNTQTKEHIIKIVRKHYEDKKKPTST